MSRRIARVCVELTVAAIVLMVAFPVLDLGMARAKLRAAIPPSCLEPPAIDYSNAGRPDYGPYTVKLTFLGGR